MPQRNRRYEASSLNRRGPGKWTQKTREDVIGSPTTLGDFQALVAEFNAIQLDYRRVLPNVHAGLDGETGDSFVGFEDRDHIITLAAYENVSVTGRTFGVTDPEDLSEVDPLGLRFETDGVTLRDDVVFIDPQGANETAGQEDAPVLVGTSGNTVTTPLGSAKTNSALWNTTGFSLGEKYRYQFWTNFTGLDEAGGAGTVMRIMQAGASIATKKPTYYVRYSTSHDVDRQVYLGKQPDADGGSHAAAIYIRGYPTDAMPVLPMSSEITFGGTDTVAGSGGDSGAAAACVRIGANANQGRENLHWRWLDFRGHRTVDDFNGVGGEVFARPMFFLNSVGNSGISFRYCSFTEFVAIEDGNTDAGTYPDYVDITFHDRPANSGSYAAVFNRSDTTEIAYCYFKGADTDIPFLEYGEDYGAVSPSGNSLLSRGIRNEGGDNFSLHHCTFEGFCSGDYAGVVCRSSQEAVTGLSIHHNVITSNGYKCLLAQSGALSASESISGEIYQNFVYNAGTADVQGDGGTLGHFYGGSGTLLVHDNTFAYELDGQTLRDGMTSSGITLEILDSANAATTTGGTQFYNNIVSKGGIQYSSGVGGYAIAATLTPNHRIFENIIHYGPSEPIKEENAGDDRLDAALMLNVYVGDTIGNALIYDNNITRDSGDQNPTYLIGHRDGASSVVAYNVGGTLMTGVSGLTNEDPQFTNIATGDFSVGNATLAAYVPNAPKTRASVGAWSPPS